MGNYVRNESAAASVTKDIAARGGTALAVQADVTDAASVEQMTCLVEQANGPPLTCDHQDNDNYGRR